MTLWLPLALIAGLAVGMVHFLTLRRVADGLVAGRMSALGLQALRMAVVAGFLFLCAKAGAGPLLAGALGLILARPIVVRRG